MEGNKSPWSIQARIIKSKWQVMLGSVDENDIDGLIFLSMMATKKEKNGEIQSAFYNDIGM